MKEKPVKQQYAFYCETQSDSTWVEPEYNEFAIYRAAQIFEEKTGAVISPSAIECYKIHQPV